MGIARKCMERRESERQPMIESEKLRQLSAAETMALLRDFFRLDRRQKC